MIQQPRSISRPTRHRIEIFAAALVAALAWHCTGSVTPSAPASTASAGSLLLDPQLVPADQSSFEQNFEGGPRSIRLGPGWQEPEERWPDGRRGIGWAEQAARIYFGVPLAPDADFVAICVPLVYPGAPQQILTPVLNGKQLASQPMPRYWTELRFALPPSALTSPINILDLHFTYQAVPARVGLGTDPRTLAAAFDVLAVVPHGEPLELDDRSGALAGRDGADLPLHRRPTALPLPPARQIHLKLGAVHTSRHGLELGVGLESWDSSRHQLWRGAAESAGGQALTIHVRDQRPARLLLQVEDGGARTDAAADAAWMDLPVFQVVPPGRPQPGKPDVFVYLIDTLRADALGVYGSPRPTSPRIDRFSRDAVVFERAYSASSWTLPSTFAVLSGLYPSHHGVVLPGDRLAEGLHPWLPEILSRQGFETLGISQWLLGGDTFGLERGFESFYLDIRQTEKNPSDTARWFLWHHLLRRRHPERPLFAYLHAVDPHALYRPRGDDARFARERPGTLRPELYDPNYFLSNGLGRNHAEVEHLHALYDGEVHAADRAFGTFVDLLKFFGVYDRSLIVLLSDHGEEFYEHGGFDHGRTLYDEVLRVPLIVKAPRSLQAGTRVAAPVSLVDLAPTIAALAGAATQGAGFDGIPLQLAGGSAGAHPPRPLFAETHADAVHLRAARLSTLKCIENLGRIDRFSRPAQPFQSFDLQSDPREQSPLSPADARFDLCHALLQRAPQRSGADAFPARSLSPEEQARLRALGYLR